ncbi:MAG: hypothetical protein FD155_3077 [Bacteroidetes bacterium]|nr:MAG: hypothetical protein FD155_3077 [Bacteroidota bacterium]
MKIERLISWFSIQDEVLIGEIVIDTIELNTLKEIFKPQTNDPLMYNPYPINEEIAKKLQEYLHFDFEFEKFIYQLDCFQVD